MKSTSGHVWENPEVCDILLKGEILNEQVVECWMRKKVFLKIKEKIEMKF